MTSPDTAASIAVAVLAAAFAALGFVGKLLVDEVRAARDRKRELRAKLVELDSLLRASRAVFNVQNELARRLSSSILETSGKLDLPSNSTFEDIFGIAYGRFTAEQRELHSLIRSMTEHAMRPLNEGLLAWLAADTHYKAQRRGGGLRAELARDLARLEAHLHLWRAKHAYWIAGNERHALVYLAEEARHGVEFPKTVDSTVDRLLA